MINTVAQLSVPKQFNMYPRMRFMGNKYKLIPWLSEIFQTIDFDSVLEPFSGSGTVSYLFKTLNKEVKSSDFLNFPNVITKAIVENDSIRISHESVEKLANAPQKIDGFALKTYEHIFYNKKDLIFIDSFWNEVDKIPNVYEKNIAITALIRSCAKRQPRGVFTVATSKKYDDGRRDLTLSLKEHFIEQCDIVNQAVFQSSQNCYSDKCDAYEQSNLEFDLVYLDPPYIPKENDNCYMKRYHFLEGVSCYWKGQEIMENSKVKKIKKPYTPFSYKRTAVETFDNLFKYYQHSKIALSYSSNSIPSVDELINLLSKYKSTIELFEIDYQYTFGTHSKAMINSAKEFLILGE